MELRVGKVSGLSNVTWVAAAYPAALILLIATSWTIAFIQLGHPPEYWVDDPKEIGLIVPLLRDGIFILWTLILVGAPVSAVFFVIGLVSSILQREFTWRAAITPAIVWAALFGLGYLNPFSVFTWLAD